MGGPCFAGGGTLDKCLIEGERLSRIDGYDRYNSLVSVKQDDYNKAIWTIDEKDEWRGQARDIVVNSNTQEIIRENKYIPSEFVIGGPVSWH